MLSNFRCSNHDLMIEKERHLGIDRQLRICPICNQKNLNIEDEFHFFFECMEYENLRLLYFYKTGFAIGTGIAFTEVWNIKIVLQF